MLSDRHTAFLSTGTNMGDGYANLNLANTLIARHAGDIVAASPVYRTAPWGLEDQDDFLNQVLRLETVHEPMALLRYLQGIEHYMGRIRETRWGRRLIDLDLILYDDLVLKDPELTVPHPRMHQRRFVLVPLADLAPDWEHPELGLSVAELLEMTTDTLAVHRAHPVPSRP